MKILEHIHTHSSILRKDSLTLLLIKFMSFVLLTTVSSNSCLLGDLRGVCKAGRGSRAHKEHPGSARPGGRPRPCLQRPPSVSGQKRQRLLSFSLSFPQICLFPGAHGLPWVGGSLHHFPSSLCPSLRMLGELKGLEKYMHA